jgi:ferredoxin-NADP reductase
MPEKRNRFNYVLASKKEEAKGVVTLGFKPRKALKVSFVPGQYAIIYLKNRTGPKGKPYSISSIPSDGLLSFTVKKLGKFSTALHNLKIGKTVAIGRPIGRFFPEKENGELVFLAAGIGIAPFFSIIKDCAKRRLLKDKKIHLFYSNKTKEEMAFFDELNEISAKNDGLKISYYLTRQKIRDARIEGFKRIDARSIKKNLGRLGGKDYFICGSDDFISDIRKIILNGGVRGGNIHTESFY